MLIILISLSFLAIVCQNNNTNNNTNTNNNENDSTNPQGLNVTLSLGNIIISTVINTTAITCWETKLKDNCKKQKVLFSRFKTSDQNLTCDLFQLENNNDSNDNTNNESSICSFKNDQVSNSKLENLKNSTLNELVNSTNSYILQNFISPYANITTIIFGHSNYFDIDTFKNINYVISNSTNVAKQLYKHSFRKVYEAIGLSPHEFQKVVKYIKIKTSMNEKSLGFGSIVENESLVTLPTLEGIIEIQDSLRKLFIAKEKYKNDFDSYTRNEVFAEDFIRLIDPDYDKNSKDKRKLNRTDLISMTSKVVNLEIIKSRYFLNETYSLDNHNLALRYCYENIIVLFDSCRNNGQSQSQNQIELCNDVIFSSCFIEMNKKYGDYMINEYYDKKEILDFNLFKNLPNSNEILSRYLSIFNELHEVMNSTSSTTSNKLLIDFETNSVSPKIQNETRQMSEHLDFYVKSRENLFLNFLNNNTFPSSFLFLLSHNEKIKIVNKHVKKDNRIDFLKMLKINTNEVITDPKNSNNITIVTDKGELKKEDFNIINTLIKENKQVLKSLDEILGGGLKNLLNSIKNQNVIQTGSSVKVSFDNSKPNRFLRNLESDIIIGDYNKQNNIAFNNLPISFIVNSHLGCTKESKVFSDFLNSLITLFISSSNNNNIDITFLSEVWNFIKIFKTFPYSLINSSSPNYDEILCSKLYNKKSNETFTIKDEINRIEKEKSTCYMIINQEGVKTCNGILLSKMDLLNDSLIDQNQNIHYICFKGSCIVSIQENENYSVFFKGKISFDLLTANQIITSNCMNNEIRKEECCHIFKYSEYQNELTRFRVKYSPKNNKKYSSCKDNSIKIEETLYKSSLSINIPTDQSDFDKIVREILDNVDISDSIKFKEEHLDSNKMFLNETDVYTNSKTGVIKEDEEIYKDLIFTSDISSFDIFANRIAVMNLSEAHLRLDLKFIFLVLFSIYFLI